MPPLSAPFAPALDKGLVQNPGCSRRRICTGGPVLDLVACPPSLLPSPANDLTGQIYIQATKPLPDKMASPLSTFSMPFKRPFHPNSNISPWQSYAPVTSQWRGNHNPNHSRSWSTKLGNALSYLHRSMPTIPSWGTTLYGAVGPSMSPITFIAFPLSPFSQTPGLRYLTRFCQRVYNETHHFTSPDPLKVCRNHVDYQVMRAFLEWSYQTLNFKKASSFFTHAKAWRMGVVWYTRAPVDPTVKMDLKNIRYLVPTSHYLFSLFRYSFTVHHGHPDRPIRARGNWPIQSCPECGRGHPHSLPSLGPE